MTTKVCLAKAMVFPVVMYGCRGGLWRRLSTEELVLLNCGVGEDSWESLALQGDPTSPSDQSWVFIGRTDVEAETLILWPPDAESWLIWKDPDAGKDWGEEEKATTEDEMVGWHHRHNRHGFGWTPGVGDGQDSWHAAVHGVTKSQTPLSDWTELRAVSDSKNQAHLVWEQCWRWCYGPNVCVLPKFLCWRPNPQQDGY